MILFGMIRTKTGTKKPLRIDGYKDPRDLPSARVIVSAQYHDVSAVLFLVPKRRNKQ